MNPMSNTHFEHNLWELLLIFLPELFKDHGTELREVDEPVPGDGVGHVNHLLLHHVQAEAHQGRQQIL